MLRCQAAVYLAVAVASTALATAQPSQVPEAEAVTLFDDGPAPQATAHMQATPPETALKAADVSWLPARAAGMASSAGPTGAARIPAHAGLEARSHR